MPFTAFPNGVSSFGLPVMPYGIPPGGNHYFMNPSHASADDGNPGTFEAPVASFETGYGLLTAGQHDTLHYIAGGTSDNIEAAVTWSKNYTHFVGHCAPTHAAQRARLFQLSTLTGASPLVTVSATGCIFANFYCFQGVDDATSLINWSVTGGRNFFHNVHFAGGGHATQAIDGGASLKLDAAEENLFSHCTIGVDTIDAATGMVGLLMDGEAHRNQFENCTFRMRAGNSGAAFIEVVDSTGIDRDNTFVECRFINNSTSNDMTTAIVAPATMGEPRLILLDRCTFHNVSAVNSGDQAVVFTNGHDAATPADTVDVTVASHA